MLADAHAINPRLLRYALALICCCALASCQRSTRLPPPPPTAEQVARERAFLLSFFFKDTCFRTLREAAPVVEKPEMPQQSYSVDFPTSPLVHDAYGYALQVRHADRVAYLYRSGGYFGVYETLGPIDLVPCLQDVFTPL